MIRVDLVRLVMAAGPLAATLWAIRVAGDGNPQPKWLGIVCAVIIGALIFRDNAFTVILGVAAGVFWTDWFKDFERAQQRTHEETP